MVRIEQQIVAFTFHNKKNKTKILSDYHRKNIRMHNKYVTLGNIKYLQIFCKYTMKGNIVEIKINTILVFVLVTVLRVVLLSIF